MRCSAAGAELEAEPVVDLVDRRERIGHERAELHVDDAVGGHRPVSRARSPNGRALRRGSPRTPTRCRARRSSSLPSLRSTLMSELSDAMIRNGSRCVCTSSAFGYSSSSAPRHHRCPGDFNTQRGARMARLQVLQEQAVVPVRGRHVGFVDQPVRVRRDAVLRGEDHAAEVAAGHAHALLRQQRAHRVHGLEAGDHELDACRAAPATPRCAGRCRRSRSRAAGAAGRPPT